VETISASQVQTYLLCPLKYRFQYVDKIARPFRAAALAFGSSVHAAIEWFHRERVAGRTPDVQAVQSIFAADWYAQNLEPLVFKDRESNEGLADLGQKMLALYVEQALREPVPTAI
jgi:putative RecB family exonuclease